MLQLMGRTISRRRTLGAALAGLAGPGLFGRQALAATHGGHAGHGDAGDQTGGNRMVGAVDHARERLRPDGHR